MNRHPVFLWFFSILGCLGGVPALPAQVPAAATAAAVAEFRFSILSLVDLPPGRVFYDSAGKAVPVELTASLKSRVYRFSGGTELVFYTPVETAGKIEKRPLARAVLSADNRKALLVLMPAARGAELPLSLRVLGGPPRDQAAGAAYVLNLSGRTVAVKVAQDQSLLQAGEERVVPFARTLSHLPLQVYTAAGAAAADGWTQAVSSMEQLLPGAWVVVLIAPETRPEAPPVRAIVELEFPDRRTDRRTVSAR